MSRVLGFEAAVLLDDAGTLVAVYPARAELVGTAIESQDTHLRSAGESGRGISEVVPSAAARMPVVAFAPTERSGSTNWPERRIRATFGHSCTCADRRRPRRSMSRIDLHVLL